MGIVKLRELFEFFWGYCVENHLVENHYSKRMECSFFFLFCKRYDHLFGKSILPINLFPHSTNKC